MKNLIKKNTNKKKKNIGIVFDENERQDYLKGFFKAKKKR